MKTQTVKSNLMLLFVSFIWGLGFVFQRAGMEHLGPFTFNGMRFALGALSLAPLLLLNYKKQVNTHPETPFKHVILGGCLAGTALYLGASLQQVGLVYTTAGKAGFITGIYVVLVPILGLFWRQETNAGTLMGVFLAAIGMYFLSVTEGFTLAYGDLLEFIGTLFWASHVQLIGWLSRRMNSLQLAFFQFLSCSVLSIFTAGFVEVITVQHIINGLIPICYSGFMAVGVAFTLQIVAQRHAHAAHAAIIMSAESVFAAIGGIIFLEETLSLRGIFGCALMLAGMLFSQFSVSTASLKNLLTSFTTR